MGFPFFFFSFLSNIDRMRKKKKPVPVPLLVLKQKLQARGGFGGRRLDAPWTCSGARWDPSPKPVWAAPGLIPQDPQTPLGCTRADPIKCPPPFPCGGCPRAGSFGEKEPSPPRTSPQGLGPQQRREQTSILFFKENLKQKNTTKKRKQTHTPKLTPRNHPRALRLGLGAWAAPL